MKMKDDKFCNEKLLNVATCDQEVFVLDRVRAAIEMAIVLSSKKRVSANDPLLVSGIDGVINGAAWEIIRSLGFDVECVNIKHPYTSNKEQNET